MTRPTTTILIGNVIDRLAGLPAKSVHCVVTSPPYWGLRDYQTGTWEGGDPACDHIHRSMTSGASTLGDWKSGGGKKYKEAAGGVPYTSVCGKCGATRQDEQIGLEPVFDCGAWAARRYGFEAPPCPGCFICTMVKVFAEVHRVLRDDGTCWVNMGDSYSATGKSGGGADGARRGVEGCGAKGTSGKGTWQPAILALALQAHGWTLRDEIVWRKPNPMPESVRDRTTKAHEMIYLLSKGPRYFYDAEAIREKSEGTDARLKRDPAEVANGAMRNSGAENAGTTRGKTNQPCCPSGGRNARSVWTIKPQPFPEAHFATFPVELHLRCIRAGTSAKGCCPACGAPWKRVTEKVPTGQMQKMADGWDTGEGGHGSVHRDGRQKGEAGKPVTTSTTTGWVPTCGCGVCSGCGQSWGPGSPNTSHCRRCADLIDHPQPVPCTVLDPFSGTGTTGIAAYQLGQHYIGCELNPDYAAMSERRIAKETRPASYVADHAEPSPLFQGGAA